MVKTWGRAGRGARMIAGLVAGLVVGLAMGGGAAAAPALLAYYPDPSALPALRAEAATLNSVAADVVAVSASGAVSGSVSPVLRSLAQSHGLSLLATVSNYDHGFKPAIAHAILSPGAAQDLAIKGILARATGLAGVNLDFEAVPHRDRALYSAFVGRLAAALHARHKTLLLSVPAKTADDPSDGWAGAFDYKVIGAAADGLQIMTYDENGPWGPPGPVAGLDWVGACLGYALSVLPAAKISLGMPAYGYDWNTTKGSGVTVDWHAIPALLARTGAVPGWDATSQSPYLSYTAGDGAKHVVWYENAASIAAKAALGAKARVASLSVWALGEENAAYWQAVAAGIASVAP